jgi:hypothetical protein
MFDCLTSATPENYPDGNALALIFETKPRVVREFIWMGADCAAMVGARNLQGQRVDFG